MLPEVQDFAESLGLKLLSKEEKRRGMRIAYSSIQLDDSNDIATRAALLVNRVISLNEARSMLGFEPVEVNGDEIPSDTSFDQVKDLKKTFNLIDKKGLMIDTSRDMGCKKED